MSTFKELAHSQHSSKGLFELKHLRSAVTAAHCGSFRRAAESLRLKQSSLSRGWIEKAANGSVQQEDYWFVSWRKKRKRRALDTMNPAIREMVASDDTAKFAVIGIDGLARRPNWRAGPCGIPKTRATRTPDERDGPVPDRATSPMKQIFAVRSENST
jgi:hypothetical protein